MTASIDEKLRTFNPAKEGAYDPGSLVVFFDHRAFKSSKDQVSMLQTYYLDTMYRLGWPSVWGTRDLEPGKLRLTWYTHQGSEGKREYPLHMAYKVKEMFDSLAEEGFRPMITGYSNENPFPMIGGSEPPPEPKQPKMRVTTSASGFVSGHTGTAGNPHDRVMAIIDADEEREAKQRKKEVEDAGETDALV